LRNRLKIIALGRLCLVKAIGRRYAIARIGRKLPRPALWTLRMTPLPKLLARLATAVLLGLGAAACTMGEEFHRGYLLDERAVSQVQPGWGAEQVLQTLGTPSTVSTVGNKSWYYISQRSRRRVAFLGDSVVDQRVTAVYFNNNLKVERVALYGLQDGKIFDFISRSTPAGGGDLNFVSQLFRGLGSWVPHT
jgi:outer membrane protein assembly factor BamE (lipoprotein component of BamABCDE complex)